MVGIADIGQRYFMSGLIANTQNNLNEAQKQVATGRKADTYGELGMDAWSSANWRDGIKRTEQYEQNLSKIKPQLGGVEQAMNQVADIARQMRNAMLGKDQFSPSTQDFAAIKAQAVAALEQVQNRLNTKVDGKYVFQGAYTDTAPYTDPTTYNTNINNILNTYLTTPAPGTGAGQTVLTSVAALGVAPSPITDLGYSANFVTGIGVNKVRVADGQDMDLTFSASDQSFQDVMNGLSLMANLSNNANIPEAEFWKIYNGAADLLNSGAKALDQNVSKVGLLQKQVDELGVMHTDSVNHMKEYLSGVEDVDMNTAITRLQALQTQMQASYQTISVLKDLSLVNYLR